MVWPGPSGRERERKRKYEWQEARARERKSVQIQLICRSRSQNMKMEWKTREEIVVLRYSQSHEKKSQMKNEMLGEHKQWADTKQNKTANTKTDERMRKKIIEINNVIWIKMAFHIQYVLFGFSRCSFICFMFESHLFLKYFQSAGEFVNCSFLLLNETRKRREREKKLRCKWDSKCGFRKIKKTATTASKQASNNNNNKTKISTRICKNNANANKYRHQHSSVWCMLI